MLPLTIFISQDLTEQLRTERTNDKLENTGRSPFFPLFCFYAHGMVVGGTRPITMRGVQVLCFRHWPRTQNTTVMKSKKIPNLRSNYCNDFLPLYMRIVKFKHLKVNGKKVIPETHITYYSITVTNFLK